MCHYGMCITESWGHCRTISGPSQHTCNTCFSIFSPTLFICQYKKNTRVFYFETGNYPSSEVAAVSPFEKVIVNVSGLHLSFLHHVSCPTSPAGHGHLPQRGSSLDQSDHSWRESGNRFSGPRWTVNLRP
uniref:Uncharacterized protein n=1 Tax=Knipowitschia caucasica TaxID=637954 RepID=A0AAV2KUM2_KNICA